MRHQSIEEIVRAIKPKHHGVPALAPISTGFETSGSHFSDSLSQAAQTIAQLRANHQAQADFITANASLVARSSPTQSGGSSVGGIFKTVAQDIFGGGILSMFPLFSGIASLFGGGSSTPPSLPMYEAPPSIQLDSTIRNATGLGAGTGMGGQVPANLTGTTSGWVNGSSAANTALASNATTLGQGVTNSTGQGSFSSHVTVNISALDSQSILDRSDDIASAVRQAVLNLHPLNSVIADL